MKDYRDGDGKLDWAAYNSALVDNGEKCVECGCFVMMSTGRVTSCAACNALDTMEDPVEHQRRLRCPKCDHRWNPDLPGKIWEAAYRRTVANIQCGACEHTFDVATRIEVHFTSPARDGEAVGS